MGILLFFYSNEHMPIHVHGVKGKSESKAEFIIEDGIIVEILIKNVKGKKTLCGKDLSNFKIFVNNYANKIVAKWIDYFIYNKHIHFERISVKI